MENAWVRTPPPKWGIFPIFFKIFFTGFLIDSVADLRTRNLHINLHLFSAEPQQRPHPPGEDAPRRGGDLGLRPAGSRPADPQVRRDDDDGDDDDDDPRCQLLVAKLRGDPGSRPGPT